MSAGAAAGATSGASKGTGAASGAGAAQAQDLAREAGSLVSAGRVDDAIAKLQAAVKLDPRQEEAWMNLEELTAERSRWAECEAVCRKIIEIGQASRVDNMHTDYMHAELAMALLKQNKKGEAMKEAQEAWRRGVREHPVFALLGIGK